MYVFPLKMTKFQPLRICQYFVSYVHQTKESPWERKVQLGVYRHPACNVTGSQLAQCSSALGACAGLPTDEVLWPTSGSADDS